MGAAICIYSSCRFIWEKKTTSCHLVWLVSLSQHCIAHTRCKYEKNQTSAVEASGCHLIQCEIQIHIIDPDKIIDGSRPDKYVEFIIKLHPEAEEEPPSDTNTATWGLWGDGRVSVYTDLGGSFVGWCASTHGYRRRNGPAQTRAVGT